MTYALNIKTIALTALLSLGAISAATTGAQAMVLHNCTDDPLLVTLMDKNGNHSVGETISPYAGHAIHATRSLGPYRIVLPKLGEGAHFSNRSGEGTFSLIRTSGGNIGIRNGNACQQPDPAPVPIGGNGSGGEVCFQNNSGFQVCLRP